MRQHMSMPEVVDLSRLAVTFMTDKEGGHHYARHYQHHFESIRQERLNILEIGIGGYENPKEGGASLRMWKEFFPNSSIFGIDICDKSPHDEHRIKTFKGSQIDEAFLKRVVEEIGSIDIIIDDGSHISNHVITTFKILFPLMSPKGIYVVEDLQTSYWENVAGQNWGGSKNLIASHTSMNFFKNLTDGLNHEEFTLDEYQPGYFDKHIVAMHFYHNLVFIYKGLNNEGSNLIGKRNGTSLDMVPGNGHDGESYHGSVDTGCRWLNIEFSSVCNLRCRWCILDHDKPKQFLSLDKFGRILQQIANNEMPDLERIDLHNGGEVLLHPEVDEALRMLTKYRPAFPRPIHVALLTNGTVLKDSTLELLTSGTAVDEIRVSVDGGTPEEFERIRTNAKWEKVSSHVKRISKTLKATKSKTTLGIICMVAPDKPMNVDWMDPGFRNVIQLADNIEIRHPHTWEGSLGGVDGLVPDTTRKHRNRLCKFLKHDLVVLANGDVSVCCADLNGRGLIGSVDSQSLSEIANGGNRQHIIELWQQGRFDEIPICSTCEGCYDEALPVDDEISDQVVWASERELEGMTLGQLEAIVARDPGNAVAHNIIGVLHSQQANNAKALLHLTKAVAANSEYIVARKNLAGIHEVLGNFDQAAYQYQCIMSKEPDDVDALFGLARLSIEASRFKGAQHFLLRVLENDPDHAEARTILDTFGKWERDGLIPPMPPVDPLPTPGNGVKKKVMMKPADAGMSSSKEPDTLHEMLFRDVPKFHVDGNGKPITWNTSRPLLRFLESYLQPGMHTLETGSGFSSVMFIGKGCVHTAVTPAQQEGECIRSYCRHKGFNTSTFTFVGKDSTSYLPGVTDKNLDVLFVDGAHRFPFPIVDWYYGTNLLKKGGLFILDDTNIISCFILMKFLEQDTHWEKVHIEGTFAVFRKLDGHGYPGDWPDQLFSARLIDNDKTFMQVFYR